MWMADIRTHTSCRQSSTAKCGSSLGSEVATTGLAPKARSFDFDWEVWVGAGFFGGGMKLTGRRLQDRPYSPDSPLLVRLQNHNSIALIPAESGNCHTMEGRIS